MSDSGILSNFEIDKIFKYLKIDKYKIISKDELKKDININNYVINLSNSNEPGTHWVSSKLDHLNK